MTREEAIEVLKDIYNYTRFDTKTINEARTMAIKALEKEPIDVVLDKIKDEIWDIEDTTVLNPDSFYERKVYIRFNRVIDIINKYKTESEAAE